MAFGGAAGQHACELAAALGIRRVVVPRHPGLLSAWGAAAADVQRDYVRTVRLTQPERRAAARPARAARTRGARASCGPKASPPRSAGSSASLDVRYVGQSYEISLPFARALRRRRSMRRTQRLYGYADRDRPVEVVNLRVTATGRGARAATESRRRRRPATRQRVRWGGRWLRAACSRRLAAGALVRGPALITEFSATTFLPPRWRAAALRADHRS